MHLVTEDFQLNLRMFCTFFFSFVTEALATHEKHQVCFKTTSLFFSVLWVVFDTGRNYFKDEHFSFSPFKQRPCPLELLRKATFTHLTLKAENRWNNLWLHPDKISVSYVWTQELFSQNHWLAEVGRDFWGPSDFHPKWLHKNSVKHLWEQSHACWTKPKASMLCSSCNSLKNKKDHSNLVPVLAPGRYQTSDSYTQCSSIGGLIWGASAEGVRAAGWLHSVLPLNERWLEMRWWSSRGPPSPCGSSSQCHAALRKLPQSKSGFDLTAPALRLQMSPSASSHSHAATLAHGSWFWYPTSVLPGKSLPGEGRARQAAPAAGSTAVTPSTGNCQKHEAGVHKTHGREHTPHCKCTCVSLVRTPLSKLVLLVEEEEEVLSVWVLEDVLHAHHCMSLAAGREQSVFFCTYIIMCLQIEIWFHSRWDSALFWQEDSTLQCSTVFIKAFVL